MSLVRGKATTVNVTATTPASGAAISAVLKVDSPSTNGVDFQVMNVVAAGDAIVGPDLPRPGRSRWAEASRSATT